jgi:hypothetical protein
MHIDDWYKRYSQTLNQATTAWPEFLIKWDNEAAAVVLLELDPAWQDVPEQAAHDILMWELEGEHMLSQAYPVDLEMPREEWINRFVSRARELCSVYASGSEASQRAHTSLSHMTAAAIAKAPNNPESIAEHIYRCNLKGDALLSYLTSDDA